MRKRVSIFPMALIFIGLLLVAFTSMASVAHWDVASSGRYEGKVSFATEEEYQVFKIRIAANDVSYQPQDISALSSSPPIIVSFKDVRISGDIPFNYGKEQQDYPSMMILGLAIIFCGVVFKWAEML